MGSSVEEYGPSWEPGPFERGTDGPLVILVGVDGSPTSLRAASYAGGLARRQRSRLVVVLVTTPSMWTTMVAAPVNVEAQEQWYAELVAELRQEVAERADELGVPVTIMVRRGDAFAELRQAATELKADLVVVGASEQAGHRIVGSVAARLVRVARWPVTVVP